MKFGKYLTAFSVFSVIAGVALPANAITSQDTGWYRNDGFHDPSFENYAIGNFSNSTVRNFGIFDISSIQGTITSATLSVDQPNDGFVSDESSETWQLHEITTDTTELANGMGGLPAYQDLGDGPVFGSTQITDSSERNQVSIDLNSSGISFLNSQSREIALGGVCATCDSSTEYSFGFSGFSNWNLQTQTSQQPEPIPFEAEGTMGLLALGVFFGYRYYKKRKQVSVQKHNG